MRLRVVEEPVEDGVGEGGSPMMSCQLSRRKRPADQSLRDRGINSPTLQSEVDDSLAALLNGRFVPFPPFL